MKKPRISMRHLFLLLLAIGIGLAIVIPSIRQVQVLHQSNHGDLARLADLELVKELARLTRTIEEIKSELKYGVEVRKGNGVFPNGATEMVHKAKYTLEYEAQLKKQLIKQRARRREFIKANGLE